jgi:hypothetical protein
MDWSVAPSSGIVRLIDVDPTSLASALDDLPDDGAAVLILRLSTAVGASEIVEDVLANLESTAHTLYPAWLPDAEVSPGFCKTKFQKVNTPMCLSFHPRSPLSDEEVIALSRE